MLKNSSKILFFMILMLGTIITISANSWIAAWMGLEINLLAFIPLMSKTNNLMSSESSLKYFLTQAFASSILLFAVIISILKIGTTSQIINFNLLNQMIITCSLLLKSGAAPFHFWFPGVMEGLSWPNALILMTWQKIAPIMLISLLAMNTLIMLSIISSTLIGSLGGLNQTSLRKLMAFSSINHIGWMLASMMSDENLWLIYFALYSFLSANIVMIFSAFNIFHFNQLFNSFFSSKPLKFSLLMNLLSLGGLPPFLGFLPKWLVIQYLSSNNQMVLMTILTMFTLITLFFYLRLCFSAFMLNSYENNWSIHTNLSLWYSPIYLVFTSISLGGLTGFSLIYNLL